MCTDIYILVCFYNGISMEREEFLVIYNGRDGLFNISVGEKLYVNKKVLYWFVYKIVRIR